MKKHLLLLTVATVLVLGASAVMVQTWSTAPSKAEVLTPPWRDGTPPRITDLDLPAPVAPVRVSSRARVDDAATATGGGLKTKAGWMSAGLLAGHFIGPAGSAGVGAAKYREDLKAGGRRRFGAIGKIGVPVAISVLAGPVGTAGYAGFQHRTWIKKHVLRIGNDSDKDADKEAKASKKLKDADKKKTDAAKKKDADKKKDALKAQNLAQGKGQTASKSH
jgi:hypothetical protein